LNKDIYSMKLHEVYEDNFIRIRKVHNGWIYTQWDKEVTSVFVPHFEKENEK
jgi:hypothetical protein